MKTLLVLTTLVIAGHCLLEDILGNIQENKRSLVTRRSYENTLNFLYRIADNNRNGRLSASELAQYTNPKDGKTPLEKARETVRLCDTNNDHELTKTGNTYIAEIEGKMFNTKDHTVSNQCAVSFKAGWYHGCFHSNLNILYGEQNFR